MTEVEKMIGSISIHALYERVRLESCWEKVLSLAFQSTHSMKECDTALSIACQALCYISIHALYERVRHIA